jgi:hypothetical protein
MEKKIAFYVNTLVLNLFFFHGVVAQDVSFDWALNFGGTGNDYSYKVTADTSGNIYTSGIFRGVSTFGTYNLTSVGSANGFITKQNPNGNVAWAKQLSTTGHAQASGITTDSTGNVYATGLFVGNTTFETQLLTPPAGNNLSMYVAKYNTDGDIVWINQFDGKAIGYGVGNDIVADGQGNIYVAGHFSDSVSFGSTTLGSDGGMDGFILKQNSNGTILWVKKIGGAGEGYAYSISVDGAGNVLTSGFFNGDVNFEGNTLTSAGQNDLFIAKHDSDGNLLWVRQSGGTGYDEGVSIAVDEQGNVYTTGHFEGTVMFGTNTLTSTGNRDGFIMKHDADGDILWVKQMGGTDATGHNTHSVAIDVNSHGNAYITGIFGATVSFDTYTYNSFGELDAFVAGYDTDGNVLWAKQIGGTQQDRGNSIHVDVNGNVIVAGDFYSVVDFDPSGNTRIFLF